MSQIDIKIGNEEKKAQKIETNIDQYKYIQEINTLHTLIHEMEYKNEKQQKRTNGLLTWILICILFYVIPDLIVKVFSVIILINVLQ